MLQHVLPVIVEELNNFLKRRFQEREAKVILSDLVKQDGSVPAAGANKIICSLVNMEQERTSLSFGQQNSVKTNPPVNLNLYVLFAAYFPETVYEESLKFLSSVIGFFQGKQVFTPQNTPGLSASVQKIAVEITNLTFHEQSNLCATLGAKYIPSVLLKMRMITITEDMILEEIPEITEVGTPKVHSGS